MWAVTCFSLIAPPKFHCSQWPVRIMPFPLKICVALPLFALLVAASDPAWAHAIIVSSSPATGAIVSKDAVAVRVRFNSRIDHSRSRLTLFAPDGAEKVLVPLPNSPADEIDAEAHLETPGEWRLRWQVLSIDGHITRGDIPFTAR